MICFLYSIMHIFSCLPCSRVYFWGAGRVVSALAGSATQPLYVHRLLIRNKLFYVTYLIWQSSILMLFFLNCFQIKLIEGIRKWKVNIETFIASLRAAGWCSTAAAAATPSLRRLQATVRQCNRRVSCACSLWAPASRLDNSLACLARPFASNCTLVLAVLSCVV